MLKFSASARISASDAVDSEYFQEIRDLPGAQIPYMDTQPPRLDPVDFIYDNAKKLTKEELREQMYAEVETYHPESRYSGGGGGAGPGSSGAESDDGAPVEAPAIFEACVTPCYTAASL